MDRNFMVEILKIKINILRRAQKLGNEKAELALYRSINTTLANIEEFDRIFRKKESRMFWWGF